MDVMIGIDRGGGFEALVKYTDPVRTIVGHSNLGLLDVGYSKGSIFRREHDACLG